jgi:hypothetical protein
MGIEGRDEDTRLNIFFKILMIFYVSCTHDVTYNQTRLSSATLGPRNVINCILTAESGYSEVVILQPHMR